MIFVSFVCPSGGMLNIAIVGVKSIGRHTVPVICRTMFECAASSLVTVATFVTFPPNPVELNCNGMEPVLPGSTVLSQVPAVVQPQPGLTSRMFSVAEPVLVKTKECFTTSPDFTF